VSEEVTTNGQAPAVEVAGQEPTTFDAEYVRQLRAEAARWRTEAQAAKGKVTEYETAQMTEAQKLQAQAAAAQAAAEQARAELRNAKAQAEIAKVAQRLGMDIELAERFATPTWDGDTLTGIDDSLKAALEKWPHLKPAPTVPALPPTNPGRQAKALTMEDVRKMPPEEINRRWDEVQAVLAGG
jgi:molecular chaperone GrpE (heat shock protein)